MIIVKLITHPNPNHTPKQCLKRKPQNGEKTSFTLECIKLIDVMIDRPRICLIQIIKICYVYTSHLKQSDI